MSHAGHRAGFVLAASLLAAAGAATAAETLRGPGIAVNAGIATVRDDDGQENFRENSFAYALDLEYRFGARFALGTNYFRITGAEGRLNGEDVNVSIGAGGVFGRIIAPLGDRYEFYTKLGVSVYRTSEDSGIGDIFGAGAYDLAVGLDAGNPQALSLRVEARYIDGEDDESGTLLTGGVIYRF